MVDFRFLPLVLEFIGEKDMRDWLVAHVRFGRLCERCADILPPQEASLINARLEEHEDDVGKAVCVCDQAGQELMEEAAQWAADNQDLLAELELLSQD